MTNAQTARGVRWWNDTNVLVLRNRAISLPLAEEILDAWFSETVRGDSQEEIRYLSEIERKNRH